MKRSFKAAIFFTYAALSGCGPAGPTCSSSVVTEGAVDLLSKHFSKDPSVTAMFNPGKSTYRIDGIRTVDVNSTSCRCKAVLHTKHKLSDKFLEMIKSTNNTTADLSDEMADYDIEYQAEMTDDKKNNYISITSLIKTQ